MKIVDYRVDVFVAPKWVADSMHPTITAARRHRRGLHGEFGKELWVRIMKVVRTEREVR